MYYYLKYLTNNINGLELGIDSHKHYHMIPMVFKIIVKLAIAHGIKNIREIRNNLEEYELKNGNKVFLIAKGRIANLVAAEGHPPEVMSLSFSNQLLGSVKVKLDHDKLNGLIDMPKEIDDKVARYALEGMKIDIDKQTQEQKEYGESYVI